MTGILDAIKIQLINSPGMPLQTFKLLKKVLNKAAKSTLVDFYR